jgi:hypothetical protein
VVDAACLKTQRTLRTSLTRVRRTPAYWHTYTHPALPSPCQLAGTAVYDDGRGTFSRAFDTTDFDQVSHSLPLDRTLDRAVGQPDTRSRPLQHALTSTLHPSSSSCSRRETFRSGWSPIAGAFLQISDAHSPHSPLHSLRKRLRALNRSAVAGGVPSDSEVDGAIVKSSLSPVAYTAKWWRRPAAAHPEDPSISLVGGGRWACASCDYTYNIIPTVLY